MRKIIGPDVSVFQDDPETRRHVDFTRMKEVADFVIVRAGQNIWPDSDFAENWRRTKSNGLPRGSYWLYDSRADPERQAELWLERLGDDRGELPLFADFEEEYRGPFTGWRHWKVFLERVKSLAGTKEVGIYTAYFYWKNHAPNAGTELEYFHQYSLWIANYGVPQPFVPDPWPANEWLFWQFTASGDGPFYGAESLNIDLNYFNGDAEAFAARFGVPVPPDPGVPDNPTGKKYRVTTGTLFVREGPGTNYRSVGYLQLNDIVEALGSNPDGTWYRIRRLSDNLTGWSSSTYLEETTGTPPPPPPPPDAGSRYRVNTRSLYVREGPGTNYRWLGSLSNNDIVELLQTNAGQTWMRVRRLTDELTGWAASSYLVPVTTPPPPTDGQKYRVTAAARVHVREGPGTQYKSLGYLQPNEIVTAISANQDQTWRQIRRSDGLTGWSYARYLALLVT